MKNPKRLNQSGQMVVEMILVLTILIGISVFVSSQFKKEDVVKNLVSGPWKNLAGLLQNGVWAPPDKSMHQHPSRYSRHMSLRGEEK